MHGTKPLARKLRVEAKWGCPASGDDIQIYKIQLTVKVQGASNARALADKIHTTTGTAPSISRV